jgi:hypothetical protein
MRCWGKFWDRVRILQKIGLALGFGFTAYTSAQTPPRPLELPFSQIFEATFDTVWEATLSVMDIYSIFSTNREAGTIVTDWTEDRTNRGLYDHPDTAPYLEQVRSKIRIKLSKGLITQTGKPATRVQVVKELQLYKNFVLDWERISSDQFEEKVLLYRIGQRLKISEALKRKARGSTKRGDL